MERYILIIYLLMPVFCIAQKKELTMRLEGENTNIQDLIDIDGFYMPENAESGNVMFFEDGTLVWYFNFKDGATEDSIKHNLSKWICYNKNGNFGTYWGVYQIKNDTIIGQFIWKGGIFSTSSIFENRYKIINRRTIRKIYYKSLEKTDSRYKNNPVWSWLDNEKSHHFFSTDSLPPSDCWLKEEKWIWRNESDWKTYMEKIKSKKK